MATLRVIVPCDRSLCLHLQTKIQRAPTTMGQNQIHFLPRFRDPGFFDILNLYIRRRQLVHFLVYLKKITSNC